MGGETVNTILIVGHEVLASLPLVLVSPCLLIPNGKDCILLLFPPSSDHSSRKRCSTLNCQMPPSESNRLCCTKETMIDEQLGDFGE